MVQNKDKTPAGFKLMNYECADCGNSEVVWNSRANVTPFSIGCPICDSYKMLHVRWDADIYAPDHIPSPGQRVFIDLPDELKPVLARISMNNSSDDGLSDEEREEITKDIIESIQPDTPWLITWPGRSSSEKSSD